MCTICSFRWSTVNESTDRAVVGARLVDAGLHETVLVLPGERVRIALTFSDFEGLYLYHCHNMAHEDNGMMRYYRVRA